MARERIERNIQYDKKTKLYYVHLYYGLDNNNKRIRKMKRTNKLKSARSILSNHETEIITGTAIIPQEQTLAEWLEYWMDYIMKPRLQETTIYGYEGIIRRYVIPYLGNLKIQQIKPITVQKYYSNMMNNNQLSSNTVLKHHNLLKTAFKYAVKQEVVFRNIIDGVEPPKKIQREAKVYNVEQLRKLINLSENTRMEIIIKLCVYLGLRREEACGLKWSDIDLDNQTIYIRPARTSAGSKTIVKSTKNFTSTRKLHLADTLVIALQKEKLKQKENAEFMQNDYIVSEYILVMGDGKPYRPNYISELFTKFLKKNNMPKIVLHELRHTFASLSNYAGTQEFDIGKAMGHSTPSTTKKIYTHLFDKKQTNAMNAVANIIGETDER
ncbi:MAG: site-specific integrase [Clostridiales bacterium]|nr:site-specific integrase [Clostridiales bacterium]